MLWTNESGKGIYHQIPHSTYTLDQREQQERGFTGMNE